MKIWLGPVPGAYNEYLGQPLNTGSFHRWRDVLDRIQLIGANDATLQLSTGVMVRPTDNAYSPTLDVNPPLAVLRGLAADIKARGMTVSVSIFSNVQNIITGTAGVIDRPHPSNPVAWFADHRARVLQWARFAQEIDASAFIVAADEMHPMVEHPALEPLWLELIDAVRAVYSGKITSTFYIPNLPRVPRSIIAKLDYLGVGFFPNLSREDQPSVETLIKAYSKDADGTDPLGHLRELSMQYSKPVWITDKAFHSFVGAGADEARVFDASVPLTPDEGIQARLYESFFQVMASQAGGWLHGVSFQSFNNLITGRVQTARFISSPVSESPQNKQAERMLADWFSGRRIAPLTNYLSNLSVRAALRDGQTLIAGFSVAGGAKPILIRAAGPALNAFGLSGALNPRLQLYPGTGPAVMENDDWRTSLASIFSQVGAFAWPAAGSRDAAFFPTLLGTYTVHATSAGNGVVLVEAYDAGTNLGPQLSNLSARLHVGTGADILIAGFTLRGSGQRRLLVRAIGPRLADFGVVGHLAEPRLTIFQGPRELASARGWSPSLAPIFAEVGAFSLIPGSADTAIVVTVDAGHSYTAQISGVNDSTGEALVEVYALP